jgi:hypothetical protein
LAPEKTVSNLGSGEFRICEVGMQGAARTKDCGCKDAERGRRPVHDAGPSAPAQPVATVII